jgi:hypothetical protein
MALAHNMQIKSKMFSKKQQTMNNANSKKNAKRTLLLLISLCISTGCQKPNEFSVNYPAYKGYFNDTSAMTLLDADNAAMVRYCARRANEDINAAKKILALTCSCLFHL